MVEEEDQKRVAKTIQQITRNMNPGGGPNTRSQGRASGPRVFVATAAEDEQRQRGRTFAATAPARWKAKDSESKRNTWTNTPTGIRYNLPFAFCATYTGNTIAENMIAASVEMVEMLGEEPTDGFAGVSIVEQALRNASGVRRPIKCFGCQGLEQYDSHAYHLWKDCPNKADQEVWKNFQINLRRFREEKARRHEERQGQGGYYGPTGAEQPFEPREPSTLVNWQRLGFPNRAMIQGLGRSFALTRPTRTLARTFHRPG
jgi:hypothetical protein